MNIVRYTVAADTSNLWLNFGRFIKRGAVHSTIYIMMDKTPLLI